MKLTDLCVRNDYLDLDEEFYHRVKPRPLKNPRLLSCSPDAAALLGLDPSALDRAHLQALLNGETFCEGSDPYAMCYAGHQFGYYVPRLGDGRAINIGTANGWHMQLKGAGQTRYSRQGDGRAVLRSSVREYLMSEAMDGLGIPSTRALALIGSDEEVARERWETGAIVLRLSPSWIRFGSFEYFYHKRKFAKLEALADFVIAESYPKLRELEDRYYLLIEQIAERTAELMAAWQAVGFNHGVMNTDNMSIAGLTIDYGPYAFLDHYDIDYVCNHTDTEGRYSFGNQPYIGQWNLSRLMAALSPLVQQERMEPLLDRYRERYTDAYARRMGAKLGLERELPDDRALIRSLLALLQEQAVDYTPFFRALSRYDGDASALEDLFLLPSALHGWLEAYDDRLREEARSTEERRAAMLRTNPKYVLKNYMLQEAIEKAENGDPSGIETLLQLARKPYSEHPPCERYAAPTPREYKNIQLSCSS
jgi:uncharacterized protein YdiU (UPF0061 family)